MTFKEEFPSLKESQKLDVGYIANAHSLVESQGLERDTGFYIHSSVLKELFLDKQRVREAIHNIIDGWGLKTVEKMQLEEDLLKELGL